MHLNQIPKQLKSCLLSIVLLANVPVWAASAPAEKISDVIQRQVGQQEISSLLSRNIMKQVPYQAEYTEEVPYQTSETYYESVPYQDTEAYTDYESYYDTEYRCRTVSDTRRECRTERECRTVPGERQCRTEQDCRNTGGGRQCTPQQICENVGGGQRCQNVEECGTSATGQRICKTRQVCSNEPGRQQCRTEQRCHDVPGQRECTPRQVCTDTGSRQECSNQQRCHDVPTTRQECRNEQVLKQRAVTKYRTVTRYRQEARTRTVTKYRTETRCCVTKYRTEFDRQLSLQVVIRFPAEAALNAGEAESFMLNLSGDENQPSAKFGVASSIYGYRIADQRLNGQSYVITLALAPKYSAAQVGENSISNIRVEAGEVRFLDSANLPRVSSVYQVQALQNGQVIAIGQATAGASKEIAVSMDRMLDEESSYDLLIQVQRGGVVLAASVQFQKNHRYVPTPLDNPRAHMDAAKLTNWDLLDSGSRATLNFRDQAPIHPAVSTVYRISLSLKQGGVFQLAAQKDINRADVILNSLGLAQINVVQHLGLDAQLAEQGIRTGSEVKIDVEIVRQSSKLNQGQPVVLKKSFIDRNR